MTIRFSAAGCEKSRSNDGVLSLNNKITFCLLSILMCPGPICNNYVQVHFAITVLHCTNYSSSKNIHFIPIEGLREIPRTCRLVKS